MQAVIMAGGKGTRLASVTGDIPKPMVPVGGKALLEWQIENLRENGIKEILLVIGHLGQVIRAHFQDGSGFGVHISYYEEQEPLGTAGALPLIRDRLEERFLLLCGDLFFRVDFNRFWSFHRERGAQVTLFAHPNAHPYDSDLLETDEQQRVTVWRGKKEPRLEDCPNLVNAGLYVLEKAALDVLPAGEKADLERQLVVPLIPEGKVFAYRSTEYVKDIGTPERLEKVEQDFQKGICQKRDLKNRQKCIFIDRDGTLNKYVGLLRRKEQMELEDRAAEAVRRINESAYLAVVVTNQPVVARGECSFEDLEQIHNRLHTLLGAQGAYLDGLYFCPHHPDRGYPGERPELKFDCSCRKPKPGMLLQAAREHNIELSESWMVGDTGADIRTGRNAGTKTALVATGAADKFSKYADQPDLYGADLLDCVEAILQTEEEKREEANG